MESPATNGNQASMDDSDESTFTFHEFTEDIFSNRVTFVILKMDSSCFIWIGDENENFEDLNLAIMTRFQTTPLASKIMGDNCEISSLALSQRLCRKLGKPVYLSCNIKDAHLLSEVEKRIFKEAIENSAVF